MFVLKLSGIQTIYKSKNCSNYDLEKLDFNPTLIWTTVCK